MLKPADVSFTTSSVLLIKSGTTLRVACGTMMNAMVSNRFKPVDRAATLWPLGIVSIPAREISP